MRTARDQILQFIYGDDGMDAHYIENMSIPLLTMDNAKMEKEYTLVKPTQDVSALKQYIYENVVDGIRDWDETVDKLDREFKQLKKDREALRFQIIKTGEESIHLPVHVPRLIQIAKEKFDVKASAKSDMTPGYVFDSIQNLLDSNHEEGLKVYQEPRLRASQLLRDANEDATWLTKIYIRSILSTRNVIAKEHLSR